MDLDEQTNPMLSLKGHTAGREKNVQLQSQVFFFFLQGQKERFTGVSIVARTVLSSEFLVGHSSGLN